MYILRNVGAGGAAVLDDATISAVQQTLSGTGGLYAPARVLWTLIGANMNVDTDQAFTKIGTFTSFYIFTIRAGNSTINLNTAAGGIYSATSKGGDALVANTQTYTSLTAAAPGQNLTLTALGNGFRSDSALYLSLTTPDGEAGTCDIRITGVPIT